MSQSDVVFLLDVDNTLIDHDAVVDDYHRHLTYAFGPELERRYWTIFAAATQVLSLATQVLRLTGVVTMWAYYSAQATWFLLLLASLACSAAPSPSRTARSGS